MKKYACGYTHNQTNAKPKPRDTLEIADYVFLHM